MNTFINLSCVIGIIVFMGFMLALIESLLPMSEKEFKRKHEEFWKWINSKPL